MFRVLMIAANFLYYFILQEEDMERFFTSLLHLLSYQLLYLDLHFDDNISWSYVEGIERF